MLLNHPAQFTKTIFNETVRPSMWSWYGLLAYWDRLSNSICCSLTTFSIELYVRQQSTISIRDPIRKDPQPPKGRRKIIKIFRCDSYEFGILKNSTYVVAYSLQIRRFTLINGTPIIPKLSPLSRSRTLIQEPAPCIRLHTARMPL